MGVDSADIEHAQERVSRFVKGERKEQHAGNHSGAAEPTPDGIFSGPLQPPLDQISVLWASASVLRDVIEYLNVDSALDVLPRVRELR